VSGFLTAHQHILSYSVSDDGVEHVTNEYNLRNKYEKQVK